VAADAQARSDLRRSELQRARGVWARKFGRHAASAAERARQMRFLAGRGFTADTIRAVLSGTPADEESPADESRCGPPPCDE
jgi:regulatory protein